MYYSEEKERKKELERLVEEQRTGKVSDERRTERLRSKLNEKWSSRQAQSSGHRLRLIFVLAALCGLVWLFFNWA